EQWPVSLKIRVDQLLSSAVPAALFWGSSLILIYNDAYRRRGGFDNFECLGQPADQCCGVEASEIADILKRVLSGQSAILENAPFPLASGGLAPGIPFTVSYGPISDERGRVAGISEVVVEKAGSYLSAASMRMNEEQLRAFVSATSDVVYHMNPDWTEMRRLDGSGVLAEALAPRQSWLETYVFPEDQTDVASKILDAVRTKKPFELEHRIRCANGSAAWIQSRAVPLFDNDGEIREWVGAASDVTKRHNAEDALRESETRFRQMADSVPALIWMTDEGGNVVFVNLHHSYLFGLHGREMVGERWTRLLLTEDVAPFLVALRHAIETQAHCCREVRVRDRSGATRWLRCEGVPRLDEQGTYLGYTFCAVDITEAHLAEEELEKRVEDRTVELMVVEQNLRQLQKMEAIGQLTGGLAHDFNNMLQGGLGGLEMARRRLLDRRIDDAQQFLDAARSALDRAAGLTRRLLAFARRQHLEPKPTDVDALISGIAELVRRTVGPAITLDLCLQHDSSGSGSILCDPNELESALLNLCINARDAMPDGGRLTVGTGETDLSNADVLGDLELKPGRYVRIFVTDEGHGMSADVAERVFEPFYTTKPIGEGTGLGLSQVYGFVRQSGGTVHLDTMVGRGTTMTLLLPRHDLPPAQTQPLSTPDQTEVDASGTTVLLVDDEMSVRAPVAVRLRELGLRVIEAEDGPAALRLLAEVQGSAIDLLITDVGLPKGMNGTQLAEAARSVIPDLPVLFITGYAGVSLPPGIAVMGKPFELETLATTVLRIIRGVPGRKHEDTRLTQASLQ
ncbi:MAG: PAS domain-containing protein, partial [Acidiphilium sp.]|nr:PAS domain-containing protein [Acidiphilium sp.]